MNEDERKARRDRALEYYVAQQEAADAAKAAAATSAAASPTPTPQAAAPAGRYAHPTMAETQRYWDGATWTDHVASGLPQRVQAVKTEKEQEAHTNGLAVAGIVMMIVFPIGGFIAGCILLGRRAMAGALIMAFSVASAYVWYSIITYDDPLDCYTENVDRARDGLPALDCE